VVAFSHKFSTPLAAKLLVRSKNFGGANIIRTSCITMYGGDRGSRAGCRPKSVMFFVCIFLFVTLRNDEVCDNRNVMKQCYGVTAQMKDCSCVPIVNFICKPPEFYLTGKFIQKLPFSRFWGL